MNKMITILFLLFSISCATESQPTDKPITILRSDEFRTIPEPYDINFQIEKAADNKYSLVVFMELNNGSYFVSPFSSDRFSGRFNIALEDNAQLVLDSVFIETPRSVEEYDPHPFVKGLVNWVSVNTSYKHQILLLSKDDFEVAGMVRFTIEPRCTFEEVGFVISYHAGELQVRKKGA